MNDIHKVKCTKCGQIFDRDAIPYIETGSRRYAHKVCPLPPNPKEEEDKVTEIFNQRFKEALENKMEIYIDNMNLRSCYRDNYKKLAGKYNVCWDYVYVQSSNINLNYERRPEISKTTFGGMIQKMDWPSPDEYDNLTIHNYE